MTCVLQAVNQTKKKESLPAIPSFFVLVYPYFISLQTSVLNLTGSSIGMPSMSSA